MRVRRHQNRLWMSTTHIGILLILLSSGHVLVVSLLQDLESCHSRNRIEEIVLGTEYLYPYLKDHFLVVKKENS